MRDSFCRNRVIDTTPGQDDSETMLHTLAEFFLNQKKNTTQMVLNHGDKLGKQLILG